MSSSASGPETAPRLVRPADGDHWEQHARDWQHFGSPLRPDRDDVEFVERALRRAAPVTRRALLLGVTPELAQLAWPAGTRLVAVDQSPGMLARVWRRPEALDAADAIAGRWLSLPLRDGSVDAIVGDGVIAFFRFSEGAARFLHELDRVLAPGGTLVLRSFVRPDVPESIDAVQHDLEAGRIGSFHAYKWRLVLALHAASPEGVRPADVHATWRALGRDAEALAGLTGWPLAAIRTIDAYRDSTATYFFPTLGVLRGVLSAQFEIVDHQLPRYELGACCPRFALRRRAR